jgi:hypothetical protein
VKCPTSACKNLTTVKVTNKKPVKKWTLLNSAAASKRYLNMSSKKPKRKRTNAEDAIEAATLQLPNKYDPLVGHPDSDLSDDESQMDETDENRPDTKLPPPIVYHGKCNLKELLQILDATTSEKVDVKPTRANTIIFAKNHDDFSKIKAVLKNQVNAEWHTYATKEEKTHGFVVFGLDHQPDPDQVKTELLNQKIMVKNVYQMKNTKFPTYVIITDRLTTLSDLQTNARAIDRIIVRWEKLKRKTQIIQCHRCQKWGHAATNCNATIKCLKCGDAHATSECTIKKEDTSTHYKIKCANCAGSHLANSTDCRVYLDRLKYIAEKRTKKAPPNPTFVDAPLPANNPWTKPAPAPAQTPAPAPANKGPTTIEAQTINTENGAKLPEADKLKIDEFIEFMDEIRRMNELINISKMLPIMKRFNGELAKQSTLVGKLAVLQGLAETFSSK